jgi:uncharacterized membrane protein
VNPSQRLPALDWMRGIVMVLMASDHAAAAFDGGRRITDSSLIHGWDQPLGSAFLLRWASHLCAPGFLFLAGTSLALSVERKRASGVGAGHVDRDLLVRGLLIGAVDLLFINWFWEPGVLLLQVMVAIGLSMIAMIALRRLPSGVLVALALAGLSVGEWTRTGSFLTPLEPGPAAGALLLNAGVLPQPVFSMQAVLCVYPAVPWCAMMVLGWVLGRFLVARRDSDPANRAAVRALLIWGASALTLFVLLRGLNGFGNLGLLRQDGSPLQWLHVSKYPPSLTFSALELGLLCVALAGLFRLAAAREGLASRLNPLLVFGQTALFFYLAHISLLEVGARVGGLHQRADLGQALVAMGAVLVLLYPLCLGYRRLKAAYPRSILRFF